MMTNDKYTRLVKLQKAFFNEHITREIPFRLCALDRLAEALVSREKQLGEALHADLGKSAFESYATEIGFLLHEIRTTKNHLQSWARDRHRPTPPSFSSARKVAFTTNPTVAHSSLPRGITRCN